MHRLALVALTATAVMASAPAAVAQDDGFEVWLNPAASVALDADTGIEIETAQRFRDSGAGRPDTYFARLWINQDIAPDITLSGAVEQRVNDGDADETRLIQQLSTSHGILRTRLRLEQRFVAGADQMGVRLRPRLGVSVPLDTAGRWSFKSDAELFLTLRATDRGGSDGLTGLRTQVGVAHELSERLTISVAYLRQQDIRSARPDRVGHAPIIGIELGF
ncbi:hypothetical protein J2Y54_000178 [Sphingomonas sp. BE123]|uniref:DUF2490 domain-containing protein n=1 Tax=Sphingomonas sp. BE123 TaxID=2817842 RepID=UPI002864F7FB|nr:DUF2490 domain-containing protein [Sphingomonas sp. BE123]MDR6850685.1 hypothetical protein [Sphingomonas sp. BE123]